MAMTTNSFNLLISCSWYKTLDDTMVIHMKSTDYLIGGLKTLDDTMVIRDLIGGSSIQCLFGI